MCFALVKAAKHDSRRLPQIIEVIVRASPQRPFAQSPKAITCCVKRLGSFIGTVRMKHTTLLDGQQKNHPIDEAEELKVLLDRLITEKTD